MTDDSTPRDTPPTPPGPPTPPAHTPPPAPPAHTPPPAPPLSHPSPEPRRRGARIFWGIFGFIVVTAAALLFAPRGALEPETVGPTTPARQEVESRPVTLYFADAQAQRLVAEEREMPPVGSMESRVAAALQALADGPHQNDAVRTLPPDVKVRRVFFDDQNSMAYVDFTPVLVTHHPGGSTAEALTLGSIVRTLGANFPEIARVQILVDGATIESIAGHFDTSKPIEIAAWP